ncbi:MAG: coenzyme F420-0:L-glutamate ligase [Dermatophilaceae bacterium]
MTPALHVLPLPGIPEIRAGDDLAAVLVGALGAAGLSLLDGDVVAVSSKVVSKALGLVGPVGEREAVVAAQSREVLAERIAPHGPTRVVRAAAGPVMAAAGVDASNTGGRDVLLLLPHDPDAVCRDLRARLVAASGTTRLGVLLTDTAGRPWRVGQTDLALGAAGMRVLDDLRGGVDADGRTLHVTARAVADEVAAAADLVKGKTSGVPAVLVRGLDAWVGDADEPGAGSLVRQGESDWFAAGSQEAVRAALGVPPGSSLARAVGVRPTGSEPPAARVARAVRVALATGLTAQVDVGPDRIEVGGADPLVVGMVAARLDAALRGEGVEHTEPHPMAGRAVLALAGQADPPGDR